MQIIEFHVVNILLVNMYVNLWGNSRVHKHDIRTTGQCLMPEIGFNTPHIYDNVYRVLEVVMFRAILKLKLTPFVWHAYKKSEFHINKQFTVIITFTRSFSLWKVPQLHSPIVH